MPDRANLRYGGGAGGRRRTDRRGECFFRDWLQQAIRVELDPRSRRLAIPIAALGFAAIHPDISFPPVFAMGLLVGLLYDSGGGLVAVIAAHATHNAVVFAAR